MTRNPVAPQYSTATPDEDDFDIIDNDATEMQLPPPTPPTQTSPSSSASTSDTPTIVLDKNSLGLSESTQREKDPIVPPIPPKPASYVPQMDSISQKMGESSLEDSFVSMGNASENTEGGLGFYSGGKEAYRSLKSHIGWSKEKVVLIAVMGMTGAGKTTFISKVTGKSDLVIGHSLESCTREVSVHETKIGETTVRFVDTPGFSDTYLSDTEVLEMIADYLAAAYSKDMKLHGIIYLHPISENRMTNPATKNLEMFRKLTGEKNLKNVVMTTSMWDKVTAEEGARRERELEERFWKVLLAYQAKTIRYKGTSESAREVAGLLMENKPFYLQLQEEMGKGNKALKDTSAGKEIMEELARVKEQHQREMAEMKEMIMKSQEEKNEIAVQALKEYYSKLLSDMEKTLRDEKRMKDEEVKTLNERISALEKKGMCNIV
ncbi:hypothetical protein TWF569_000409 [Orbilia oligospora]|uniref:G domain-containing protein n=1 Tax=Orbilia oligospora TaxID=2813651 RepID=A0A7C8NQM9_ORBOL|nr:hypothetical protein TWF706_011325 [Orbilia oligospora]KAF3096139.1 hypothetical protein TWF102_006766 [Orbilia oligospora]KAF3117183.1 hypothetical protein TWF103_007333 [Orbilia oligospora]KAF3126543.1 hypothetical protein TWF703_010414 [Orbilia oligospora]KAF3127834.1 hypothetical protein TWF594_000574 [Orbilia oligospora]